MEPADAVNIKYMEGTDNIEGVSRHTGRIEKDNMLSNYSDGDNVQLSSDTKQEESKPNASNGESEGHPDCDVPIASLETWKEIYTLTVSVYEDIENSLEKAVPLLGLLERCAEVKGVFAPLSFDKERERNGESKTEIYYKAYTKWVLGRIFYLMTSDTLSELRQYCTSVQIQIVNVWKTNRSKFCVSLAEEYAKCLSDVAHVQAFDDIDEELGKFCDIKIFIPEVPIIPNKDMELSQVYIRLSRDCNKLIGIRFQLVAVEVLYTLYEAVRVDYLFRDTVWSTLHDLLNFAPFFVKGRTFRLIAAVLIHSGPPREKRLWIEVCEQMKDFLEIVDRSSFETFPEKEKLNIISSIKDVIDYFVDKKGADSNDVNEALLFAVKYIITKWRKITYADGLVESAGALALELQQGLPSTYIGGDDLRRLVTVFKVNMDVHLLKWCIFQDMQFYIIHLADDSQIVHESRTEEERLFTVEAQDEFERKERRDEKKVQGVEARGEEKNKRDEYVKDYEKSDSDVDGGSRQKFEVSKDRMEKMEYKSDNKVEKTEKEENELEKDMQHGGDIKLDKDKVEDDKKITLQEGIMEVDEPLELLGQADDPLQDLLNGRRRRGRKGIKVSCTSGSVTWSELKKEFDFCLRCLMQTVELSLTRKLLNCLRSICKCAVHVVVLLENNCRIPPYETPYRFIFFHQDISEIVRCFINLLTKISFDKTEGESIFDICLEILGLMLQMPEYHNVSQVDLQLAISFLAFPWQKEVTLKGYVDDSALSLVSQIPATGTNSKTLSLKYLLYISPYEEMDWRINLMNYCAASEEKHLADAVVNSIPFVLYSQVISPVIIFSRIVNPLLDASATDNSLQIAMANIFGQVVCALSGKCTCTREVVRNEIKHVLLCVECQDLWNQHQGSGSDFLPLLQDDIKKYMELLKSEDHAVRSCMVETLDKLSTHIPSFRGPEMLKYWFSFLSDSDADVRYAFANKARYLVFEPAWLRSKQLETEAVSGGHVPMDMEDRLNLIQCSPMIKLCFDEISAVVNSCFHSGRAELQTSLILTLASFVMIPLDCVTGPSLCLLILLAGHSSACAVDLARHHIRELVKARNIEPREIYVCYKREICEVLVILAVMNYEVNTFKTTVEKIVCILGFQSFEQFLKKAVHHIIAYLVPQIIKKPENVKFLDELAAALNTDSKSLLKNNFKHIYLHAYLDETEEVLERCIQFMECTSGEKIQALKFTAYKTMQNELLLHYSSRKERVINALREMAIDDPYYDMPDCMNEKDIADYLQSRFLGVLVYFDTKLVSTLVSESMRRNALCSLPELILLMGPKYITPLRFKVLATIRMGLALNYNDYIDLNIAAWIAFVKTVEPRHLGPLLSTIFVSLLPLFNNFRTEITKIFSYLIMDCHEELSPYFKELYFIKDCKGLHDIYKEIHDVIHANGAPDFIERLSCVTSSIRHENVDVQICGLTHLLKMLENERSSFQICIGGRDHVDPIVRQVMDALLHGCQDKDSRIQMACANCIGAVGALDPGHLSWRELQTEKKAIPPGVEYDDFAVCAVSHLARSFQLSRDSVMLDAFSVGIQELMKIYQITENTYIWNEFPEDFREIIAPLQKSFYKNVIGRHEEMPHPVIWSRYGKTLSNWARNWGFSVLHSIRDADIRNVFEVCEVSMKEDLKTMLFFLPYILLHGILNSSERESTQYLEEVLAVMHHSKFSVAHEEEDDSIKTRENGDSTTVDNDIDDDDDDDDDNWSPNYATLSTENINYNTVDDDDGSVIEGDSDVYFYNEDVNDSNVIGREVSCDYISCENGDNDLVTDNGNADDNSDKGGNICDRNANDGDNDDETADVCVSDASDADNENGIDNNGEENGCENSGNGHVTDENKTSSNSDGGDYGVGSVCKYKSNYNNGCFESENKDRDDKNEESFTFYSMLKHSKDLNWDRDDTHILCSKTVFHLTDFLWQWMREWISVHYSKYRTPMDDPSYSSVKRFLDKLPKLEFAKCNAQCGEYPRALMFLEMYVIENRDNFEEQLSLFTKIFASLYDSDAVRGVMAIRQHEPYITEILLAHEVTGQLQDAAVCYESLVHEYDKDPTFYEGMVHCYLGLDQPHVALRIAQGVTSERPEVASLMKEFEAEAFWRLQMFDDLSELLSRPEVKTSKKWGLEFGRTMSLFHSGKSEELSSQIESMKRNLVNTLGKISLEKGYFQDEYKNIVRLHMLHEIHQMDCMVRNILECSAEVKFGSEIVNRFLEEWKDRLKNVQQLSRSKEPILCMRRSLLLSAKERIQYWHPDLAETLKKEVGKCWLSSAITARKENLYQQAYTYLIKAETYHLKEIFIEKAKFYWDTGERDQAFSTLRRGLDEHFSGIQESIEDPADKRICAKAKLLIALYNERTVNVDSETNIKHYIDAIKACPTLEKSYVCLAQYHDSMLNTMSEQERCTKGMESNYAVVHYYSMSLRYGCNSIYQSMPRLFSVWLNCGTTINEILHKEHNISSESLEQMKSCLARMTRLVGELPGHIPAYMFMTSFSQLISRIGHPNTEIYHALKNIIALLLMVYPQHCMWMILPVHKSSSPLLHQRCQEILNSPEVCAAHAKLLRDFVLLADHLIELTERPIHMAARDSNKVLVSNVIRNLPRTLNSPDFSEILMPFQRFTNLILPASKKTETDHNPFPSHEVYIKGIDEEMIILPSLQKPRRITLVGSDGKRYMMMCKAQDDLRKDFRFMEFNNIVNRYLRKNPESKQRGLLVRTYHVVPLNEECGIVEWVPNLLGFRPVVIKLYKEAGIYLPWNSLKNFICSPNESLEVKLQMFLRELLPRHPPILDEWFKLNFPEPYSWYRARTAYVRTTAVMSMVGYIMGLGDRHGENIQLDRTTGETVHVDFNCLFNKGEKFKYPERVPFRLTHNMVAAMGPLGVEGVFRRSCEITLHVLRGQIQTLMSVLQPFLYDPMVSWPSSSLNEQSPVCLPEPSDLPSQMAAKHLRNIESRLQGMVRYFGRPHSLILSVEGQAESLIEEATKAENLSQMYIGWAPYL